MRFKVDSDITVEITQRGRGMKRLNASNVVGFVTSNMSPPVNISGVCLGHANGEVFKHPTKEFEIRQLNGVFILISSHGSTATNCSSFELHGMSM